MGHRGESVRPGTTAPVEPNALPSSSGEKGATISDRRSARIDPTPTGERLQHRPAWDHGLDHLWHGHRYHWNDGSWVIIDNGLYPYSADVSPDESVLPDVSSDVAEPVNKTTDNSVTAEVQTALADLGYFHGDVNGVAGADLVQAILRFQREHKLPATGVIDQGLIGVLLAPTK